MSQVIPLPSSPRPSGEAGRDGDIRLVRGLRDREPWAGKVLVDRYHKNTRRVLVRVMGVGEPDLEDLVQDVFTRALRAVDKLTAAEALTSWLTKITVFTARRAIRRRSRQHWLLFTATPPDRPAPQASAEVSEAVRAVYSLLYQIPYKARIPFVLQKMEGMDLKEIALVCDVSVPTVRRRLKHAELRFSKLASRCETLSTWMRTT